MQAHSGPLLLLYAEAPIVTPNGVNSVFFLFHLILTWARYCTVERMQRVLDTQLSNIRHDEATGVSNACQGLVRHQLIQFKAEALAAA